MQKLAQMNNKVIEMQNIWVQYDQVTVLEGINLSVYQSDFLGIIGPNGGGKTTLLKVILGLIRPNQGRVSIFGHNPEKGRQYIGYVPQYLFFDRQFPISVKEVVLTGRLRQTGLFKRYKEEDYQRVIDVLNQVGIYKLRNRQIGQLSGGEMKRVLIARALVTEPQILLLDEPAANIDNQSEIDLYALLKELNEKIPIVMVSHDIGVISSYVNKVACLNRCLYYHNSKEITLDMLKATYKCPMELIAHGVPHRVLQTHH